MKNATGQVVRYLIAELELLVSAGITDTRKSNILAETYSDLKEYKDARSFIPFTESVSETLVLLNEFHKNLYQPISTLLYKKGTTVVIDNYFMMHILIVEGRGIFSHPIKIPGDGVSYAAKPLSKGVILNIPTGMKCTISTEDEIAVVVVRELFFE